VIKRPTLASLLETPVGRANADRLRPAPSAQRVTTKSPTEPAAPRRSKYGAQPTIVDGIRFPSKLEARRYTQLAYWRQSGEWVDGRRLISFALWPVFVLEGGVKAILDSVQIWTDGTKVEDVWEDVKGKDLPESRLKRRQIEARYSVRVQLWPPR
jgi:hypothetical protein